MAEPKLVDQFRIEPGTKVRLKDHDPAWAESPDIRAGRLKVVDIGLQATPEYLYVAHPEGRKVSAKLRALVDWLRTAFGDPPYWEVGEEG